MPIFLPFLAWNLGCGFAQNHTQLIIFRLMAGLGGSAPLSVSINDLDNTNWLTMAHRSVEASLATAGEQKKEGKPLPFIR